MFRMVSSASCFSFHSIASINISTKNIDINVSNLVEGKQQKKKHFCVAIKSSDNDINI